MYGRAQVVRLDAVMGGNVRIAQANKLQLHCLNAQPGNTIVLLLCAFQNGQRIDLSQLLLKAADTGSQGTAAVSFRVKDLRYREAVSLLAAL